MYADVDGCGDDGRGGWAYGSTDGRMDDRSVDGPRERGRRVRAGGAGGLTKPGAGLDRGLGLVRSTAVPRVAQMSREQPIWRMD